MPGKKKVTYVAHVTWKMTDDEPDFLESGEQYLLPEAVDFVDAMRCAISHFDNDPQIRKDYRLSSVLIREVVD